MNDDWYDETREEFLKRMREWDPGKPGTQFHVEVYETYEEEIWERRKEFDMVLWREGGRYPVKVQMDCLKQSVKMLDILLRHDRLSPEAMGFTSRKVSNLIKLLEQLKEKLDAKDGGKS